MSWTSAAVMLWMRHTGGDTVKRLLIMIITMAVTIGTVTNAAATTARSERTLYGSYGPNPSPVTGCNEVLGSWACMIVRTQPTERYVAVKVTDTHGLPVYFSVFIPSTGFWVDACGEIKAPIAFGNGGPNLEIEVGVSRWVAQTKCPASSVKTTGTIKVTLSDQP